MTVADTFFKQFEILADAPNAVPRLRELILQLAVRGKLVSQDPNDEPASVLLEKIKSEKQKFIEQNRFAKEKELPKVEDTEIPNNIPKSWLYRRLGELFIISSGTTPSRVKSEYFYQGTENWIKTTDLNNSIVTTCEEKITIQAVKECNLKYYPVKTVCIAMYGGAGTIGKSGILGFATTINQSVCGIYPNHYYCPEFLHIYVKSIRSEWMNFAAGLRKDPNINGKIINNMIVPLPPLNEQKRIVEKVDKLMEWCDRLEKQQQQRRETCINLNRVALTQLTTAKTTDEFSDRWQKVRDNFDLLYSLLENVSQLRQTILQLAVMGKLVKQDSNDKSALSILKKQNPKIDNYFFSIPQNWILAKLENLGDFLGGGTPSKSNPEFWNGDIPWISPRDMKKDYLSSGLHFITTEALKGSTAQMIPKSSLLMVVRGMILAHSFPVAISMQPLSINQDMKALKLFNTEAAEYLLIACKALKCYFLAKVARSSHGTCKLDSKDLTQFFVPIPPLNEQKRIVAKVEEMMRLCDGLEAKLKEAETNRQKLLESGIRQVLSQI